jgi:hypothetical protein
MSANTLARERGPSLHFAVGEATLWAEDGILRMRVTAADTESLTKLEAVVGSQLVRFGQRDELTVNWDSADNS